MAGSPATFSRNSLLANHTFHSICYWPTSPLSCCNQTVEPLLDFRSVGMVYSLAAVVVVNVMESLPGQHQKKPIVAVFGTILWVTLAVYGLTHIQTYSCK